MTFKEGRLDTLRQAAEVMQDAIADMRDNATRRACVQQAEATLERALSAEEVAALDDDTAFFVRQFEADLASVRARIAEVEALP